MPPSARPSRPSAKPNPASLILAACLVVGGFEAGHPGVRVEADVDDAIVDLGSSEFDIAVRAAYRSSAAGVSAGDHRAQLEFVCAPALIGGADEALADRLNRLGVVGVAPGDRHAADIRASLKSERGASFDLKAPRRFAVTNQIVAYHLALEGLGAALLIGLSVAEDLAAGRLVRVDDRYDFGFASVSIVSRDRYPTPAAKALATALAEASAG